MTTVRLDPVYLGQAGELAIYRVDLSQSGLANIGTITIHDDNILSGGTGSVSGLDLDFVKVIGAAVGTPSDVLTLGGVPVFNFGSSGVVFEAGYQTPLWPGDPSVLNTNLQGTSPGNVYDPVKATLGVADSKELSLGESGRITFLLSSGLTTSGRYFYFGDAGGNGEGAYVSVSSEATAAPTDFVLVGTPANDTFILGAGLNAHLLSTDTTVFGRAGNDTIVGALGNDTLYGEAGRDSLSGGDGNDTLLGGTGEDRLNGGAGNDWLYGLSKNDTIAGGTGNDTIAGGSGNDRLYGGQGRDVFVFDMKPSKSSNVDRIYDFNPKYDSFQLENAVFSKLGSGSSARPKKISADMFVKGKSAQDKEDRLIYDQKAGALYYDKDGTGGASQVKIATLTKGLKLTYNDFFVI